MKIHNFIFLAFHLLSTIVYNQTIDGYSSELAKEEISVKQKYNTSNISFENISSNSEVYILSINSYNELVEFNKLIDKFVNLEIIYLNNVRFLKSTTFKFHQLPKLSIIKFESPKGIPFNILCEDLKKTNLKQLHIRNASNIKKFPYELNSLKGIEVLSITGSKIREISGMDLSLRELNLSDSKKRLDLSELYLPKLNTLILENSKINVFPLKIGKIDNLQRIDFKNTIFFSRNNTLINGFHDLLELDISNSNLTFRIEDFINNTNELSIIFENYFWIRINGKIVKVSN